MKINVEENIELYPIKKSDAKDIFHTINCQREYLGKWLPFVAWTEKIEDTERFLDSVVNETEESSELVFTIRIQNEFIGIIGLKDIDKLNKKAEIGYWISEKHQKLGIITKSVNKLCDFAFDTLDINRIQIKCATDNNRSKNIPKRLGFKHEGIERDGELLTGNIFTNLDIYSKLKCEWLMTVKY